MESSGCQAVSAEEEAERIAKIRECLAGFKGSRKGRVQTGGVNSFFTPCRLQELNVDHLASSRDKQLAVRLGVALSEQAVLPPCLPPGT